MNHLFEGCLSLISIPDISNWDITNVADISDIFSKCYSLISMPNISKWKFSNNDNNRDLFNDDCLSLINLPSKK